MVYYILLVTYALLFIFTFYIFKIMYKAGFNGKTKTAAQRKKLVFAMSLDIGKFLVGYIITMIIILFIETTTAWEALLIILLPIGAILNTGLKYYWRMAFVQFYEKGLKEEKYAVA